MNAQEVIIVSDLWGKKGADWFSHIEDIMSDYFKLSFIDACELAEINLENYTEEIIHKQFVEGGIDLAVNKLLEQTPTNRIYLGCSIGGVILWKAALQGFRIDKLITISSTRLRYESVRPDCLHKMYFGKNDKYLPDSAWFNSVGMGFAKIVEGEHEIYKDKSLIWEVLTDMK